MDTMSAKEQAQELIERLPEDVSMEEIRYRLYVREKIEQGIKDVEEGRVISHEEVVKRMSKWLED